MSKIAANTSIDMRGKTITTFILYETVKQLQRMSDGDVLEIVTDNYAAIESDMNAWSRMTGQKLLEVEKNATYHRYYVEKASFKKSGKKLMVHVPRGEDPSSGPTPSYVAPDPSQRKQYTPGMASSRRRRASRR